MIFFSQWGRRFKNSRGFSLVEVVVAMAVSMVIATIASFAFLMAFDVYVRTIRQYEVEIEMSSLMYHLRASLMTGTNVLYGGRTSGGDAATSNISEPGLGVSNGYLFSITDDDVPVGGTFYDRGIWLVAQFNRERGLTSAGVPARYAGKMESVQITYQRPGDATRVSGLVLIDTEENPAAAGGWVTLSPVNAPFMFTRLTDFSVRDVKVVDHDGSLVSNNTDSGNICTSLTGVAESCEGRPVMSAEINMTMRYFSKGQEQDFNWCNRNRFAFGGQCGNMPNTLWHDIDRKMTIVFANNSLKPGEYLPRRPFGNIYFFRPWAPPGRSL